MFSIVQAANNVVNLNPNGTWANLGNISLTSIVPVVIQVILIVAALVALIFLIIGGIKWITSGGDKAQVESARGTITSALIGLVIVFSAWAIIKLLGIFFNIDFLNPTIPNITLGQ